MPMKKLNMLSLCLFSFLISFSCTGLIAQAPDHTNLNSRALSLAGDRPQVDLMDHSQTINNANVQIAELNTKGTAQSYPWLSNDGLRLYYTNGESMYMASRSNQDGKFSAQHEVFSGISEIVISGWLTPDELNIYFANQANQLFKASRADKSSSFTTYSKVKLINAPAGSLFDASFTPDMMQLFMYNNDSKEQIVKFEQTRRDEYTFKEVVNVLSPNTPTGGQVSRDGLRFYVPLKMTENGNTDYRKLYVLSRPDLNAEFNKIEKMNSVENINCSAYQPCVNADESRCVFVTGYDNAWSNNDLCEVQLVRVIELVKNEVKASEIKNAEIKHIDDALSEVPMIIKFDPAKLPSVQNIHQVENTNQGQGNEGNGSAGTNNNATVTVVEVKGKLEMNIAPNPVIDKTQIEVVSPIEGHMTITIYSQTGQLVSTVYDGQTDKGLHIFNWAKNVLSNGVYTVRTVVEKQVVVKKIVVCGGLGPQ
jgi:hypothetical protein